MTIGNFVDLYSCVIKEDCKKRLMWRPRGVKMENMCKIDAFASFQVGYHAPCLLYER